MSWRAHSGRCRSAAPTESYDPVHVNFSFKDEQIDVRLRAALPVIKPPLTPDLLLEFRSEKPAGAGLTASAKIMVKSVELEIADRIRVGWIRGFGSSLNDALTALGVEHAEIKIEELRILNQGGTGAANPCEALARFDTIVIDERAYLARPQLRVMNDCLLRYVQAGGN